MKRIVHLKVARIKGLIKILLEYGRLAQLARANCDSKETRRFAIFTGFALSNAHIFTEIVFAKVLRRFGYQVILVFCDGLIDECEFSKIEGNGSDVGRNCKSCMRTVKWMKWVNRGDIVSLREIKLEENEKRLIDGIHNRIRAGGIDDLRHIRVGSCSLHEHAMATVCRQDLASPRRIEEIAGDRYRRLLVNALKMYVYSSSLIRDLDISNIVCTHGVYLNHGPLTDVSKDMGLECIVWGFPYRRGTYYMTRGDTYHRALQEADSLLWNHRLTRFEEERVTSYLVSKESGGRDYWHYKGLSESTAEDQLSLISDKRVVVMFTNVDWDAQIYYDNALFKTQLEWIKETVEALKYEIGTVVVIRIHPAENDILKSRSSLYSEIKAIVERLGAHNVVIVRPDDSYSSYRLIEKASLVTVYGSKISLESCFRGKPTIICGNSLFRQEEIAYLPKSREEYSQMLISDLSARDDQIELSKRFGYFLYFRVFQECRWLDDVFKIEPKFRDLGRVDEEELLHGLLDGTN